MRKFEAEQKMKLAEIESNEKLKKADVVLFFRHIECV